MTTTGLDDVDLWIGGLAEKILPFGGMLGSTFNFVFEVQMEKLQKAIASIICSGSMACICSARWKGIPSPHDHAHTDATHLPSDVFSTPGLILEVDPTRQFNDLDGDGTLESTDPTGGGILTPLVIRNNPSTMGPDTNYLRYTGDEHVVLGGTEGGRYTDRQRRRRHDIRRWRQRYAGRRCRQRHHQRRRRRRCGPRPWRRRQHQARRRSRCDQHRPGP